MIIASPLTALIVPTVLVSIPLSAVAPIQTTTSMTALRQWIEAVSDHASGEPDGAVRYVAGMTYSARVELNKLFPLFIKVLQANSVATRSEIESRVAALARTVGQRSGSKAFLKRAAMLHTEALIFSGRFPRPPDDAPPPLPRTERERARTADTPPLLYNEWISLARDGEVLGDAKADWNLPFARSLLDVLLGGGRGRVPQDDRVFVGEWYHAVSAFLFASGNYADATPHLQHAARVLPDDPHVLFDRATYAETLGLPIYQSVLDDRAYGNGRYVLGGIPSGNQTNGEAERLYRRTLAVDPSYVEARVRLARLLERRGQYEEAAAQITAALDGRPSGVPLFFAHLIAGRIASGRGRYEDALRHYRAALGLNGGAQSALLGASHAALMLADVREAVGPVQQLAGSAARSGEDPWLDYEFGAGRDAAALLTAVRARVPK
jgi:tetratricopeptide (TPR) repeat protein